MRRFAWSLIVVCLFLAAACSSSNGELRGATPVGLNLPVANPLIDVEAETVTIEELAESPEEFDGMLLQVSGTYFSRPVVVCSTRPQLSPARWALSDGEVRIPASGLDARLEELPSGQIELTVFGRLLRWQGPVGCGRQAEVTEVWYLEVVEVISPNPITVAAVGTAEGGVSIELEPPETSGGYPGPGGTGESEGPQVSATGVVSGTNGSESPQPIGTPALATPSPTSESSSTGGYPGPGSAASPSPTTAVATGPNTPTITTSPGGTNVTPTPTPGGPTTSGSPAPTVTSGGNSGEPVTVDQETLPPDSIETAELMTNEMHRWPFVITSTTVITVNIATQLDLDAGIAIRDPSGNIVAQQNKSQDNSPEIMVAIPLNETGTYDILITNENNASGHYAILVLNDESYTFVFNGTLDKGQSESAELRENNDHFWNFFGTAGETITIRVTPADDSNLFIRMFGADATLVVDFHDETGSGEVEELLSFTLPDTGFYSILVGELNFGASNYMIALMNG